MARTDTRTSPRLRILFVTFLSPYGESTGTRLRIKSIGSLLRRIGDVSLVICPLEEICETELAIAREEYTDVDVAPAHLTPIGALVPRLRHELDPAFLNTHGFAVDEAGRDRLLSRIERYDVVWIHSIRSANAFRIASWPRSVLDVDDLHSALYASMGDAACHPIRRALHLRMAMIWRAREARFSKRFKTLAVCSEADRDLVGAPHITHVVRNGFDAPAVEPKFRAPALRRIGFIGLLRYLPNREGVEWFIRSIWPLIKMRVPEARLRLVGQGCDEQLLSLGMDIDSLGYVEDPTDEIASWSAMIVPIRFGGGTRVKIAEAFSRKCPVVSTALGAFGYGVTNLEELLLADTAHDFANACVSLLIDRELGTNVAKKAYERFIREWTWDAIGQSVERAVEFCVEQSPRTVAQERAQHHAG